MSAFGYKRAFWAEGSMSAFGGKADIPSALPNVRFSPVADIPFIRLAPAPLDLWATLKSRVGASHWWTSGPAIETAAQLAGNFQIAYPRRVRANDGGIN